MFVSKLSPVVLLLHLTERVPLLKVPVTGGPPWRNSTLPISSERSLSKNASIVGRKLSKSLHCWGDPPPLLGLFSGVLPLRVHAGESQKV